MICGNQFASNHVPLEEGWNDITSKAADADGIIQEETVSVFMEMPEGCVAIYNALGANLQTLASQMQEISWICYTDGTAKYRIRQGHDIEGEVVTITYFIFFRQGASGLWLIEKY